MACAMIESGMRDEVKLMGEDVKSYVANMCQDGVWGGELELIALSRVLQRTIEVNKLYVFPADNPMPPISLHFEEDHYEPLK